MHLVPGTDCVLQRSEVQHLLVITLLKAPKLAELSTQRFDSVQDFMVTSDIFKVSEK